MNTPINAPIFLKDYQVSDFLIETVDLIIELKEEKTQVTSKLTINRNPAAQKHAPHLRLNGEELLLKSVKLNGNLLTSTEYTQDAESLTIFTVPDKFILEVIVEIKPQENTALSGLYQSSGNFCTQCEPHGFRRITYYLDRPDVLAKFKTTIIADKTRYPFLLSNGNCIDTQVLADGNQQVTWEDPFKKPCYLFALVAGNFEHLDDEFVTRSGRKVILRIFVEKGNRDKCAHAMQAVKKAMHWDEMRFNREYDLDIYMIVAVSDFNMGAMENKGLNIFNTQYILAKPTTATDNDYVNIESVIAHEYFHNWSGNRITCRDWFQLSLKEGLTIFRDQSFTADTTSKTVARINDVNDLRNSQFPEDAGPLAHPVQPDSYIEINNFYTATVYNKGAEVIRMQQVILGEELFARGMDLYFEKYDGQAVTIEEFVKSMEEVSDMDLQQFRLWYKQAGTPVLKVTEQYDAENKRYLLTVKQTCPATPGQPHKKPFHIPIKMGLLKEDGIELVNQTLQLTQVQQTFQFDKIAKPPILSFLRGFSAPVKVEYEIENNERLLFLFKHDTDLFNRWDAGQHYAVNLILKLMQDLDKKLPEQYVQAFRHLLATMAADKLLLSEMIMLPSLKYISEQMERVDIDAIHLAREFVLQELSLQLKDILLELYQKNHSVAPFVFNIEQMGQRQIKNACLSYLTQLNDPHIEESILLKQFKESYQMNMTDGISALRCLVNCESDQRDEALEQFYDYWKTDALVVDKWIALQASSKLPQTLDKVKQLLNHPAFDIKNPNKVYSLVGTFGRNLINFHKINGEGYEFLTDCVLRLDKLNPQVAARMVKPFSDWRRYDILRQNKMHEQLKLILNTHPSKDVYEIVVKSLGE